MASPQKEHGFTPIANEILEALSRADLAGSQFRVILAIIRDSYGWGRKHSEMSYAELARRVLMLRPNAIRAVRALRGAGIISDSTPAGINPDTTSKNRFIFNKDYHQWGSIKNEGGIRIDTSKRIKIDTTPPRDIVVTSSPMDVKKKEKRKPPVAHVTFPHNGGETPSFLLPPGQSAAEIPNLVGAFMRKGAGQRHPREIVSIPETVRKVLLCFKTTQDFAIDDKGWDRVYFKKLANDAEDLLDVFAGNVVLAVQCAAELGGEFRGKGLKFTLATIVKHAAEWKYKNAPKDPAKP